MARKRNGWKPFVAVIVKKCSVAQLYVVWREEQKALGRSTPEQLSEDINNNKESLAVLTPQTIATAFDNWDTKLKDFATPKEIEEWKLQCPKPNVHRAMFGCHGCKFPLNIKKS